MGQGTVTIYFDEKSCRWKSTKNSRSLDLIIAPTKKSNHWIRAHTLIINNFAL